MKQRHPTKTPAGAYLELVHGRRWSRIVIDRWPITNCSDRQADAADGLSDAASRACFAAGRRKAICLGAGPTVWSVTCPREHADEVVAALFALERDDYDPAAAYVLAHTGDWSEANSEENAA